MAIGTVSENGNFAYVYDPNGRQLFSLHLGGANDRVTNWTSSTVSVRRGNFIYTYDDNGRQLSAKPTS
jgi:hypothetical protein